MFSLDSHLNFFSHSDRVIETNPLIIMIGMDAVISPFPVAHHLLLFSVKRTLVARPKMVPQYR